MYSNSLGNFYHPSEALVNEMKYPEGADLSQFVLKKPLVVNIGSIKGSIGDNQNGGAYPYRVVQQDSIHPAEKKRLKILVLIKF